MAKIYDGKKYMAGWENGIVAGHRLIVQNLKALFTHAIGNESAEYRKGYEQALKEMVQWAKVFDEDQNLECTCGNCEAGL